MEGMQLRELVATSRKQGVALAQKYRLGLRQPRTSGTGGNWLGVGTGSSVDFQDHRPYAMGDDPRYINWQAYARSGEYTMKLYREEVSPSVDIVFDISGSMFEEDAKLEMSLALFYFCVESSLSLGAALRCYALRENRLMLVTAESIQAGSWLERASEKASRLAPDFDRVPWRPQSARIVISDLLFPGLPNEIFRLFSKSASWTTLLSVYSENESSPSWKGGMNLVDSETGANRILYCDQSFLKAFKLNYEKHFSLWSEFAQRSGAAYLRLDCGAGLEGQLLKGGARSGVLAV